MPYGIIDALGIHGDIRIYGDVEICSVFMEPAAKPDFIHTDASENIPTCGSVDTADDKKLFAEITKLVYIFPKQGKRWIRYDNIVFFQNPDVLFIPEITVFHQSCLCSRHDIYVVPSGILCQIYRLFGVIIHCCKF